MMVLLSLLKLKVAYPAEILSEVRGSFDYDPLLETIVSKLRVFERNGYLHSELRLTKRPGKAERKRRLYTITRNGAELMLSTLEAKRDAIDAMRLTGK